MAYDDYDRYWTIDIDGNKVYKEIHRDLMEKKLGRKLLPTEVVHHIDGNKKNNDIDNLLVFRTFADHSRYHMTGIMIKMEDDTFISPIIYNTFKCKQCGEYFKTTKKHAIFCSQKCHNDYLRIDAIPTRKEMIQKLKITSIKNISREYDVSYDVAKAWVRRYHISLKRIKKIRKEKEKNKKYVDYTKVPITIINKKNLNERLRFKNIYALTEYFKKKYDTCENDYCIRKNIIRVLNGERKSYHGYIIKAKKYQKEKTKAIHNREICQIEKELRETGSLEI